MNAPTRLASADSSLDDPRRAFAGEPVVDLSDARVAVLGCGSAGSLAAWACASAGVGELRLADRDRLEAGNVRRHACGSDSLGQTKPKAVAHFLKQRFPALKTVTRACCFLDQPDTLRDVLEPCDLVLAAVDDEAAKYLIDAVARDLGRPVLYAGVYGGGWATELILSDRAEAVPCYGCAARALGRGGIAVTMPNPSSDYAMPIPDRSSTGWPRADLTSILPCATLAARLTTAWLAKQRGHDDPWKEFRSGGASAWRFALRHVAAWSLGPWQLAAVSVSSRPDCFLCGASAGDASPEWLAPLLQGVNP